MARLCFVVFVGVTYLFLFSCREEMTTDKTVEEVVDEKIKEEPIASPELLADSENPAAVNPEKEPQVVLLEMEVTADGPQLIESSLELQKQRLAASKTEINAAPSESINKAERKPVKVVEKKKPAKELLVKKKTQIKKKQTTVKSKNTNKTTSGKGPMIKFDKDVFDYGSIDQGEKVEHKFTFKNTGTKELVITNAIASCGCTMPSYPFIPIAPGEEGYIGVIFDSTGKLGKQKPMITITTNANPSTHKIYLDGYVDARPTE